MAKSSSRNYSDLTIKRLFSLSGNRCAFPECSIVFLNWDNDTNFSNICHIEDANANTHKADRYNPHMTPSDRASYKNLILLCPNHHNETNDPLKYTVDGLRKMKREHENSILKLTTGQNLIVKNSSILSILINQVGSSLLVEDFNEDNASAPNTDEKINFNNIVLYKPVIEEYSIFQGKLNSIYEEIENQGSSKKDFLLQNIRTLYLKEKGKYKGITEIRINADSIFENIENELWNIIEVSDNLSKDLPIEALKMAVLIVMVDAFMRCKILEEPNRK